MLGRNAQNKNGKNLRDEDYFAVLIQLNYDENNNEKSRTFFAGLYYELTVNFGFNFCDRVFYRIDSKDSIVSLLNTAMQVIAVQQHLTKEDLGTIVKHAFIIPLHQFDDVKREIL